MGDAAQHFPSSLEREIRVLEHFWSNAPVAEPSSLRSRLLRHFDDAWRMTLRGWISFSGAALAVGLLATFVGVYLIALRSAETIISSLQGKVAFSIYLKDGVSTVRIEELRSKLLKHPSVRDAAVQSKEAALKDLQISLGADSALLEGLEKENPLPASIDVEVEGGFGESLYALADELGHDSDVERVYFGKSVAENIAHALERVSSWGFWSLAIIAVLLSIIVGITVRLFLYGARNEIRTTKIFGASDAQISAPFVIQGALLGLFGGAIGAVILGIFVNLAALAMSKDPLWAIWFPSSPALTFGSVSIMLLFSLFSGLIGSFLSVRSFLKDAP